MKKIITILFLIIFIDTVNASNLYISKRDIDTQDYVSDCDFLLYDENNVIVDAWIANNETHEIKDVKDGIYKLVERPKTNESFSNELSVFHEIDVKNESLSITLYNNKIETPRNLGIEYNTFFIGCSIIFLGIAFIYIAYRKFYYI